MSTTVISPPTVEMVPIVSIKIAPGNPRRSVGDVAELAASIKAHGVLEPLLGIDGNGEGVLLVAGQRRLVAAKKAGLTSVPMIMRPLDERARLEVQLIENLQREDLEPVDEALAFKRLLDLGLTQTELGERVGRSQSHISKRLLLLKLPEPAIKKLNSGGITLQDAVDLTKLADHPERLERALKQPDRWQGIAGAVDRELELQKVDEAKAGARAKLQAAGVKILKEEPFYSWSNRKEKPLKGQREYEYEALDITVAKHEKEPCHAAAIDQHARVTYVCTEPKNHPGARPKRDAGLSSGEKAQRTKERNEAKKRREAESSRAVWMQKLLKDVKKGTSGAFIVGQFVQHASSDEARIALELIQGEKPKKDGHFGYFPDMLAKYADKGENELWRAGLALAFATGEMPLRSGYGRGKAGSRHTAFLQASGYKFKPNEKNSER